MSDYASIKGYRVKYLDSDPTLNSSTEGQVWYNSATITNRILLQTKAWSSGGALPTGKQQVAGAGTQDSALSFGGLTPPGSAVATTEEYFGATWRQSGDMNTARRLLAGCGTQTAGLAFGGHPDRTDSESYNGSTWTSTPALGTGAHGLSGTGLSTAALAAGGAPTSTVSQEYNGSSWTAGGTINTARAYGSLAGTQTSSLYMGGQDATAATGSTESYNGTSWTALNSMNTARLGLGAGGSDDTHAVVFQGNGPDYSTATEEFDGVNWTTSSATAANARQYLGDTGTATAALSFGGRNPPSTYNTSTEEYVSNITSQTTGTWVSGGSLNLDRTTGNILGTSTTSALYVGGYRGPTPSEPSFQGQTAVESYNGTSWSTSNALPVAFYSGFSMGTTSAGLRAGGNKSTAKHGPDPTSDESEEYNGSSWTSGGTLTQKQHLGASAGTQTAGLLWAGKSGAPPSSPTLVSQEYDGSSFTAGGSVPSVRIRTMGAGTQTAAINFGGHPSTPNQDLNQSATYNGSSWTAGPNMSIARNAAMGAGTQTLAICGGGYMYQPPGSGSTAATEWYDGTSWANVANNVSSGPRVFSGPSGSAATDCLAVEGPTGAQEWTGQPGSTTSASTLTTSS